MILKTDSSPERGQDLALDLTGLTVAYDAAPVLWDASLRLELGRLMAIVGPNGAGKSTLLKAALGMLPRLAGRVRVFGNDPRRDASRVAYVPQRASVDWDFPATVLDVVLMGTYGKLGWFRRPRKSDRDAAREAIRLVEMERFADRQIGELSGGQQQRVFLARALVQSADLYVMDEPFAGVDAVTERAIVSILKRLRDEGQSDPRRPPRPGDGVRLLRRCHSARSPRDRQWPDGRGLHARSHRPDLRWPGVGCSIRLTVCWRVGGRCTVSYAAGDWRSTPRS